MPSLYFNQMALSRQKLRKQLLSFPPRIDGKYSDVEMTQLRAYLAFCHSEIEIYLEMQALRSLVKIKNQWIASGKISKSAISLMAYCQIGVASIPDDPTMIGKKSKISYLVNAAISSHEYTIRSNHGIRKKNFGRLFVPLGLQPEDMPEPLLIQLESFGSKRGGLVHNKSSVSISNLNDPFSVEDVQLDQLMAELKSFDSTLSCL